MTGGSLRVKAKMVPFASMATPGTSPHFSPAGSCPQPATALYGESARAAGR
jgi:hypothetical protein